MPQLDHVAAALARELLRVLTFARQRGRGRRPWNSLGRSIPVCSPIAEFARLALDHVAVAVGELADFEEVGVRGDLQRFDEPDRAVVGVARRCRTAAVETLDALARAERLRSG